MPDFRAVYALCKSTMFDFLGELGGYSWRQISKKRKRSGTQELYFPWFP